MIVAADLDGPKSTFGRSTLGDSVTSANALENSFADDFQSATNSPTICQFFWLSKLSGFWFQLQDFSDG